MKEWWNNLALREKQLVSIGGIFLVLFLIYFFLWSPLNQKVASLRSQIRQNQDLLAWMKDTDKEIQSLEKTSAPKPNRSGGSLLSLVQKQVEHSSLSGSLSQLHQVESDSVQLTFKKVDFDKLIAWLIEVTQQEGLVITQLTVTPSGTPGIVGADLILKT